MSNATVNVPAREVPVIAQADVVVVGAGVAGFCAALAAARNGAKTILLERNAFPGGVATAGLMCSVTNFFVTRTGERIVHGLPAEFVDRLVQEGVTMPDWARPGQPQIPNEPEAVKRVMITMLREAKVKCLYQTYVSQVVLDADRIDAVVFEGKGGPFAIRASQFVDASGDLDLFALAGGPCEVSDGFSSLLFRMADVNIDAVIDWLEQNPESYSATKDIPTSLDDTIRNWRTYGVFHLPHYAGKEIKIVSEAIDRGELPETFGRHLHHL